MSADALASTLPAELFGSDGRIKRRVRQADGRVWCPKCRDWLNPSRFYLQRNGEYSNYCREHRERATALNYVQNPDRYQRTMEYQKRWKHQHLYPRQRKDRLESAAMARAAIAWLRGRGLWMKEIASLCGLHEHTIYRLIRHEAVTADRHVIERVTALLQAASDMPPGDRRGCRHSPHPLLPLLHVRMREPLAEIESRRDIA